MKPLNGWPRKGSVLAELRVDVRRGLPIDAMLDWSNAFREAVHETWNELWQETLTDHYRAGVPNAGLSDDVIQAIQRMHGTPQFLSHSGLQIVPVAEEELAELDRWLKIEREWRARDAEMIDFAMRAAMNIPFPPGLNPNILG